MCTTTARAAASGLTMRRAMSSMYCAMNRPNEADRSFSSSRLLSRTSYR